MHRALNPDDQLPDVQEVVSSYLQPPRAVAVRCEPHVDKAKGLFKLEKAKAKGAVTGESMWKARWVSLLLLLMIWQSPGLPWRKVNFITVTRRPHRPNIAAGLCCLATSPGFLPTLCEKWSGFFYVHRVFLSYTRDRRLKVSSERLGNEDKAPCPRALLPGRGSNRGPPVWKSEALTARPRQLL